MTVVHWAYINRIERDDPRWRRLPGGGMSVDAMIGDIEPPAPARPHRARRAFGRGIARR